MQGMRGRGADELVIVARFPFTHPFGMEGCLSNWRHDVAIEGAFRCALHPTFSYLALAGALVVELERVILVSSSRRER